MTRGQHIAHLINVEGFTRSEAAMIVDETAAAGFIAVDRFGPLKFTLVVLAISVAAVLTGCAGWVAWDIARGWGKP